MILQISCLETLPISFKIICFLMHYRKDDKNDKKTHKNALKNLMRTNRV